MALGSVWCSSREVAKISERIKEIKKKHGLSPYLEIKWVKVSQSKLAFYMDLVDYFFDDDDLHFRALVVSDKSLLRHDDFDQSHDTWLYKMYFYLLRNIISTDYRYYIYIDIKDTRSGPKLEALWDVLSHANYDFSRTIIKRLQAIRSDESQLLQLTDLMLGVMSAATRGNTESEAKKALIKRVQDRSRFSLTRSTLPSEQKFNIFQWQPRNGGSGLQ